MLILKTLIFDENFNQEKKNEKDADYPTPKHATFGFQGGWDQDGMCQYKEIYGYE
jgi:hypothetical protein